jgi:hypothetical protein
MIYDGLPPKETAEKTMQALKARGISTESVNKKEGKKILSGG